MSTIRQLCRHKNFAKLFRSEFSLRFDKETNAVERVTAKLRLFVLSFKSKLFIVLYSLGNPIFKNCEETAARIPFYLNSDHLLILISGAVYVTNTLFGK